jgi:hypothetical protein
MEKPRTFKGSQAVEVSEGSNEALEKIRDSGRVRGGLARAANLTPERRREIASLANRTRWNNARKAEVSRRLMVAQLRELYDICRDIVAWNDEGVVANSSTSARAAKVSPSKRLAKIVTKCRAALAMEDVTP